MWHIYSYEYIYSVYTTLINIYNYSLRREAPGNYEDEEYEGAWSLLYEFIDE